LLPCSPPKKNRDFPGCFFGGGENRTLVLSKLIFIDKSAENNR
jgi:hypothetical protein